MLSHAPAYIFNNIANHEGCGVGIFTASEKIVVFPEFFDLADTPACRGKTLNFPLNEPSVNLKRDAVYTLLYSTVVTDSALINLEHCQVKTHRQIHQETIYDVSER